MLLNEVIIPIVGPAFLAGILWLLAWRPWRTPLEETVQPSTAQSASLALALGAGLFLGYLKLAGWPPMMPKTATHWLSILAVDWALLGYGVALLHDRRPQRLAYVLILAAITGGLQSIVLLKYSWGVSLGIFWIGLFAALAAGGSELLSHAARRRPGAGVPLALFLAALGLFVSILLSYSAFLGQLAAMLTSMMAAAIVVSLIAVRFSLAGPGVTVFYVFYLSLIGHGYFYSTVPVWTALLLVVAPLSVAVLPPAWEARSWRARFLNVALSLLLSGGAIYIAYAVRMANIAAGQGEGSEY